MTDQKDICDAYLEDRLNRVLLNFGFEKDNWLLEAWVMRHSGYLGAPTQNFGDYTFEDLLFYAENSKPEDHIDPAHELLPRAVDSMQDLVQLAIEMTQQDAVAIQV